MNRRAVVLLVILFVGTFAQVAWATERVYTCSVFRIIDGDTLIIRTERGSYYKVRLVDVDCPELSQPFGQQAKEYVSKRVSGKTLTIQQKGRDKYGRTLGLLYLGTDTTLNEELVEHGLAWVYKSGQRHNQLLEMQRNAKNNREGLWSEDNPINPEEWRKMGINHGSNSGRVLPGVWTSSRGSSSSTSSGGSGTVHVSGYTRSDGTRVSPYTRSAPSKK